MGRKLFVGNLSYGATEADIRDAFAEFGEIASVKVVLDRDTGRPRGFAFVEMASDDFALQAMQGLHGRELMGRPLTVREAEERPPTRRGDFGVFGGMNRGGGGGGGAPRERGDRGGRGRW